MAIQLLQHTKRIGERIYRYYSLAEPYREQGKNKKRVLSHLGRLEPHQVIQIRQALCVYNDPSVQLVDPKLVQCTNVWRYLDLAVFHQLWKKLGVGKVFKSGDGDIELSKLCEIMVLNRCTEPTSKLGVTRWYPSTGLAHLLGVQREAINESRLYRCLTRIEQHHQKLEQHIFSQLNRLFADKSSSSIYFYDLSSSYFEGEGVSLAAYNQNSKDHRPDRLQVVLGLLINEKGIPFSWEILKGNQADALTLIKEVKKFKKRFGIKRALLVFDRGFLSHDNLLAVEKAGYHYLTGLKKTNVEIILLKHPQPWLSKINTDNVEKILENQKNWERFDENTFYYSLGIVNNKKTVLLFKTDRYRSSLIKHQTRIDEFKQWVNKRNQWLASFKRDAIESTVRKDVDNKINQIGLQDHVSYELHRYITENETFQRTKNNPFPSQGHMRKIRSFQIIAKEHSRNFVDGLFALITSPNSNLSSEEMMVIYRQKYLIEHAFREMKSILKLRPWFVYKEDHIKAHYTICVLAFVLERILDLLLEINGCKEDGWSLYRLKEQLAQYHFTEIEIGGHKHKKMQKIPSNLRDIITKIGLKPVLNPQI